MKTFIYTFIRIKTYILNIIFWPYIYFDYQRMKDLNAMKMNSTMKIPEYK